jgi:hypothetical protein
VVLDPEGFGGSPTTETGTTQQKTADWQDWVTGWSQGIHSVDPNLTPALYTNESDILTYGLQNLGIPLFPAETPISGHTPSVLGDAVSGYIAYYATCPAGDDVAEVKGWGAGYNTVQFDRHTAYCGPQ